MAGFAMGPTSTSSSTSSSSSSSESHRLLASSMVFRSSDLQDLNPLDAGSVILDVQS